MNTSSARLLLVTAFAALLASCAQQVEVIKLYDSPIAAERHYAQLLVVGIAADPNARQHLETMIAQELRAANATAVTAYTETGLGTTLLQEEIDNAARRSGSDAILVTHIVSVDTQADIKEGRVDVIAECRGGDPADYFLYDYDELKEPDTVRLAHTVVAVTSLYDVGEAKRVWTIQSTCFEKATMYEVFSEKARAIARQLQIDNFIA